MFCSNNWYVAAFASHLAQKPVARMICGKPVVLFRTADGAAVALEDRCIHRGAPLSLGECERGNIRCPYHGLEFDGSGRCVVIPGQARIPEAAAVASYRLIERDALLWIWAGEQDKADPSLIPA